MADPTTTNIQLAVPTRGADVGTWDVPLNGDMTILDACAGGITTKATTGGVSVSLTVTEAQVNLIRITGTLTANAQITIPSGITKTWSVLNNCVVGSFYVNFINQAGGQAVALPPGEIVDIVSDGTNMMFKNLGRVGSYWDYAGAGVPAWVLACTVPPYLNCDGSTFSSATYPTLYSILGTTTLPDLRGRQRIFLNQGTGRVTTANAGIDGNTRFSSGGLASAPIIQAELPAITPTFTGNPVTMQFAPGAGVLISSGFTASIGGGASALLGVVGTPSLPQYTPTGSISTLGSGTPRINMDPTCVGGITMIRAA